MRIGSLFSGAGGLDMAVEQVFGGHTVWHCEVDPAASKVLAHRWPGMPNLGDITTIGKHPKVGWDYIEPIDILCCGWPCQPFSLAGKRKGADDQRALWPYVARAVRMVRPRIVVLENVSAVLGPEFTRVANDLASLGYDIVWTCLRASDVGAPHRRARLFVVATDAQRGDRQQSHGHPDLGRWTYDTEQAWLGNSGPVELLPTTCAQQSGNHVQLLDLGMSAAVWGKYEAAIRRWEQLTRTAPAPTEPNKNGNPRLAAAFSEWMMGWPAGWVTQVPGISRNDQLRIIGNGVVPQQAEAAIRWLLNVSELAA